MLAAMVVTAVVGGRKALHELFGRMFRLGPHGAVKLMLALSPLALGAVAWIAILLLGKTPPSAAAFAHFPGQRIAIRRQFGDGADSKRHKKSPTC